MAGERILEIFYENIYYFKKTSLLLRYNSKYRKNPGDSCQVLISDDAVAFI